ncbi:hypothetical protein METBIDRAFT_35885 [Metschnikowia bicuspidata var. bicuspidata NRRL YB-4993]|uniref:HPP transmembrane region domain-containing protein n=1 Tax=Metschnikowia bicuspidata var. bicuspidata NRRL YB-4993 TaxID=869754 RepID=A0A1A0HKV5_9ASCO|nr:hypothetical protein METBIDRAFT_35885 [Metschnikowia bicuspidata var. bicuspidata NRRL YB-4993]OBA24438.1 hypothetical protein METBIDRAFT_35885 [Metschnikowia bicuspidata var. bicuspidata NRRL YB-4993]
MFKFTIDDAINRYLWPSQVSRLPSPVARFLGGSTPRPVSDLWLWLEILVSTFCGIAVIEAIFKTHTVFSDHNAPLIIASYGASAILCFNANGSPLAQPRNVIMGQFLSSLIGLCVQKLFLLSSAGRDNYWAGGALSVAILSVAMSIFNCVHPPGGASALLPCTSEEIQRMSWWYLPAQLVSSVVMVAVACIFGNILRSYPSYWWSGGIMGKPLEDTEKDKEDVLLLPSTVRSEKSHALRYVDGLPRIEIDGGFINLPAGLELSNLEKDWLTSLQKLMAKLES